MSRKILEATAERSPVGNSPKRHIVYRDEGHTEMWVESNGSAKSFARQLIRDGKTFTCEPCTDGGWSFTVYEFNHPNRWESE